MYYPIFYLMVISSNNHNAYLVIKLPAMTLSDVNVYKVSKSPWIRRKLYSQPILRWKVFMVYFKLLKWLWTMWTSFPENYIQGMNYIVYPVLMYFSPSIHEAIKSIIHITHFNHLHKWQKIKNGWGRMAF